MKILLFCSLLVMFGACTHPVQQISIDRKALVNRNNPQFSAFDSLASLSVGNGEFAFTVDITGLQTFPDAYKKGVPLGTQSQWGWHSFANMDGYRHEETLSEYDFGRGHKELYAVQSQEDKRQKNASDWFRANPHRLHLGVIGFEWGDEATISDITRISQTLNLWEGEILSRFTWKGNEFNVRTVCHPAQDMISAHIDSHLHTGIKFHFPYPTGIHTDNACDWDANDKHSTEVLKQDTQSAVLKRTLDSTVYYVELKWEGKALLKEKEKNYFVLLPQEDAFSFSCAFTANEPDQLAVLPDFLKLKVWLRIIG